MRIAALLVNFRDASGTAAAAESVRRDDPATELVIVDNSDDDGHWKAIRAMAPGGASIIRSSGNLGFARACNLALQHTDAALLILVNPDVRLLPGCTLALRNALASDSRLAAVAPRQYLDEDCQWILPPSWLPTAIRLWAAETAVRSNRWYPRWTKATHTENLRCWLASSPLRQRALSGSALMIRRTALHKVANDDTGAARAGSYLRESTVDYSGFDAMTSRATSHDDRQIFDPRFFMYFEDSDLCLRLKRMGWRLALVPTAHAIHSWRNAPHKGPLMRQGMEIYLEKHYGTTNIWLARHAAFSSEDGNRTDGDMMRALEPLRFRRLDVLAPSNMEWCVEVSPHANLWPAVGHTGRGPTMLDLDGVLDAVADSRQAWLRLSKFVNGRSINTHLWHWRDDVLRSQGHSISAILT